MNDATPRKPRSAPAKGEPSRDGRMDGSASLPAVRGAPTVTSTEQLFRILENEDERGPFVVNAELLRAMEKALVDKIRASAGPVFTPGHLSIVFGKLTPQQQLFLKTLLEAPGRSFSYQELTVAMLGGSGVHNNYHSLNQAASVLRKRLGSAGCCIETVSGFGFRWNRDKEPKELTRKFLRLFGLSWLAVLAAVAGALLFSRGPEKGGGPTPPFQGPGASGPFQAMRDFSASDSFGEPSASVAHAKGHSPWRTVDGASDTWFESAAPARKGDWISFRFPSPLDGSSASRIGILFGRPDADVPPFAPPCRVECAAGVSGGGAETWVPIGDVDPASGRFVADVADLPLSSVEAVRIVVTADSDLPLVVREAGFSVPETE